TPALIGSFPLFVTHQRTVERGGSFHLSGFASSRCGSGVNLGIVASGRRRASIMPDRNVFQSAILATVAPVRVQRREAPFFMYNWHALEGPSLGKLRISHPSYRFVSP